MSSLITSILSTLKGAALIALCALAGARLLSTFQPCKFAGVTFAKNKSWIVYEHEADPAGYDTLHCRKTLYIRRSGGPDVGDLDLSLLDDDGDVVGMGGVW
ncbi:MAG: hypothetical protein LQ341_001330 [Variospora aurantia]|nr:MAG: hypothetical protein LQ341_001330 [Variospora aurantia]